MKISNEVSSGSGWNNPQAVELANSQMNAVRDEIRAELAKLPQPDVPQVEPGLYWVDGPDWTVGEFNGVWWNVLGWREEDWATAEVGRIGPRIERPDVLC